MLLTPRNEASGERLGPTVWKSDTQTAVKNILSYEVKPLVHSKLGMACLPVMGSRGGRMSKTARIFAKTSQAFASARKRPGQILTCFSVCH